MVGEYSEDGLRTFKYNELLKIYKELGIKSKRLKTDALIKAILKHQEELEKETSEASENESVNDEASEEQLLKEAEKVAEELAGASEEASEASEEASGASEDGDSEELLCDIQSPKSLLSGGDLSEGRGRGRRTTRQISAVVVKEKKQIERNKIESRRRTATFDVTKDDEKIEPSKGRRRTSTFDVNKEEIEAKTEDGKIEKATRKRRRRTSTFDVNKDEEKIEEKIEKGNEKTEDGKIERENQDTSTKKRRRTSTFDVNKEEDKKIETPQEKIEKGNGKTEDGKIEKGTKKRRRTSTFDVLKDDKKIETPQGDGKIEEMPQEKAGNKVKRRRTKEEQEKPKRTRNSTYETGKRTKNSTYEANKDETKNNETVNEEQTEENSQQLNLLKARLSMSSQASDIFSTPPEEIKKSAGKVRSGNKSGGKVRSGNKSDEEMEEKSDNSVYKSDEEEIQGKSEEEMEEKSDNSVYKSANRQTNKSAEEIKENKLVKNKPIKKLSFMPGLNDKNNGNKNKGSKILKPVFTVGRSDKVEKGAKDSTNIPVPRFVSYARKLKVPNFAKIHEKAFKRMEALDDYVDKKRKRTETIGSAKKIVPAVTPGKVFQPSVTSVKELNMNFGSSAAFARPVTPKTDTKKQRYSEIKSAQKNKTPGGPINNSGAPSKTPGGSKINSGAPSKTPGARPSMAKTPGGSKINSGAPSKTPGARQSIAKTGAPSKTPGTLSKIPGTFSKTPGTFSKTGAHSKTPGTTKTPAPSNSKTGAPSKTPGTFSKTPGTLSKTPGPLKEQNNTSMITYRRGRGKKMKKGGEPSRKSPRNMTKEENKEENGNKEGNNEENGNKEEKEKGLKENVVPETKPTESTELKPQIRQSHLKQPQSYVHSNIRHTMNPKPREALKKLAEKQPGIKSRQEIRDNQKKMLKNVRLNRRFELHMASRGISLN